MEIIIKVPVYRETPIDLNILICFHHHVKIIMITITAINVLKICIKIKDNVKYV